MYEQSHHYYPNTDRQIALGDTVTHINDATIGGIVYGMNDRVIDVAWAKWDPAVEAALLDQVNPDHLRYKGRN
jgi:hypothetical protein